MLILGLFGLDVQELHLFLSLGKGQLMSVIHLLRKLVFGLLFVWVEPSDYLLLVIVVLLVLGPRLESCRNQSLGLRSQYIHSFNIIDVLLFLRLERDC